MNSQAYIEQKNKSENFRELTGPLQNFWLENTWK